MPWRGRLDGRALDPANKGCQGSGGQHQKFRALLPRELSAVSENSWKRAGRRRGETGRQSEEQEHNEEGEEARGRKSTVAPASGLPAPPAYSGEDYSVGSLLAANKRLSLDLRLRAADASFLESALSDRDRILRDVGDVLDAVERRQGELEGENKLLCQKIERLGRVIDSRDREVAVLKGVGVGEEMF